MSRRLRSLVLVLAMVLAAACSEVVPEDVPLLDPTTAAPADGTAAEDGAATTGDGADAADAEAADDGAATDEQAPADEAPGDEQPPAEEQPQADDQPAEQPAAPALTPVVDDGPVGANAAAYLRGDRPTVILEIDRQEGVNLPDSVVDHVASVLARESNANVEVRTGSAVTTRRDVWSADQLRAAADATRDVAHDDRTAVLHLLALRDGYEDDGVLGLAFGSSSAVVFPDQWSDLTTALLSGDRIARAVTTHEVGHLLGLVGLFEPPQSDHEDPEHPGHTTDEDDVMFWAVERSLIAQLDGIPVDFGPNSRADLAAIREG